MTSSLTKITFTTMIGFLMAIVKNFFFIGWSVIEALVFMIAFNYLAPAFSEKIYVLPVLNLEYLQCLSLFILIHFIGRFIQRLTPTIISLKNTNKEEK